MEQFLENLRKIERAHQLRADYEKTLALLASLKAGDVQLDWITLTADGWTVAAPLPPAPAEVAPAPAETPEEPSPSPSL